MNNEPVAWRTHYPSGWEYKDGNPPFELKGNSQLLYINPVNPYKAITNTKIAPVAFVTGAKEFQRVDVHTVLKVGTPLYTHPAELTDEEIHQAIRRGFSREGFLSDGIFLEIKELLRNKQGVNSEQVPDFFFMENDLMGKR